MRILHLTTFLQGGAGRVITDLAAAQSRAGHDVAVLTSRTGVTGYGNYPQYLDELAACRVATHQIDSLFHRNPALNLAVVQSLAGLSGTAAPDVIHAHAAVPAMIGLLFTGAGRHDLRIVQTMHGWGSNKDAGQTAADVAVMNLIDRVATPSVHSANRLVELGVDPARVTTIPYGVRSQAAPSSAADDHLLVEMARARRSGALVVACVGTMGARKNQTLLVEAAAIVTAHGEGKRPDIFLVFVGEGDPAPLDHLARAGGIAERVRVHGYSAAARRIAAASDLLVLPSHSEGQPIALLEAFYDDLLVGVSDLPELRELVEHRISGLTFRANDAAALADLLATAAALPAPARRSMRNNARERVRTHHTLPAMVDAYDSLYRAQSADTPRRSADRLFSAA
jgi:glycosyltransferase involved in cell wall biosynthesis